MYCEVWGLNGDPVEPCRELSKASAVQGRARQCRAGQGKAGPGQELARARISVQGRADLEKCTHGLMTTGTVIFAEWAPFGAI